MENACHIWRGKTSKEAVMAQECEAGKELFVDGMSDTLPCVADTPML